MTEAEPGIQNEQPHRNCFCLTFEIKSKIFISDENRLNSDSRIFDVQFFRVIRFGL